MTASDVVIVGAGIGGSVLALDLAQRGRTVSMVERDCVTPRVVRPETLRGHTIATFERLGLSDRLGRESMFPLRGYEIFRGDRLLAELPESDFVSSGGLRYSTDPGTLRETILQTAVATGAVTVHRPVRVHGLRFQHDRVVGVEGMHPDGAPFTVAGRIVVGDDGMESTVRTALGIPIHLRPFPLEFVTALLDPGRELPAGRVLAWVRPAASRGVIPVAALVPWPRGQWVAMMALRHGAADRLFAGPAAGFWREVMAVIPSVETFWTCVGVPAELTRVRRLFGHAARYVKSGAVLIGDAAHPMSPAGGQGANAAVADAAALAEAIDASLGTTGVPADAPLLDFECRRRPANALSLRLTERAAMALRISAHVPRVAAFAPALIALAVRFGPLRRAVLEQTSTAFVTRR